MRLIVNLEDNVCYLFDGGRRSSDRDQLITEYELTNEEADTICRKLEEIQNASNEERLGLYPQL